MNYFTNEHEMFRESLRDFLNKEVKGNINKWESEQKIPKDIWKKMGEQGFLGLTYPEKYGGFELDFFFEVILFEEMSKMNSWVILPKKFLDASRKQIGVVPQV